MPKHIAKYGRPMPYFMKYRSEYYAGRKLSRSASNMNRLCWEIEKWGKRLKWRKPDKPFDWGIMTDGSLPASEETAAAVEEIYLRYCRETKELCAKHKNRKYNGEEKHERTAEWTQLYGRYRSDCMKVCVDEKTLANIAVKLCYGKYPKGNKSFIWRAAGEGVIANIKAAEVMLPLRRDDGEYTYLGKRYALVEPTITAEFNG